MGQLLGGKWLGKEERGRVAWWALRWTDGFMDGYMESGSELLLESLKASQYDAAMC